EVLKSPIDEDLRGEVLIKKIQSQYQLGIYKQMRETIKLFNSSYPKREDRWIPYFWNAKAYLNESSFSDGFSEIQKAENINSNPDILSVKVQLMINLGNDAETGKEMENLIDSYPGNPGTDYAYVKWFDYNYQKKQFSPIVDRQYRLKNTSLYYNDYLMILAQTYFELEDYSTALDVLGRMTDYIEKKSFYQALCYEGLGRIDEAKNILTRLYQESTQQEIKFNSFYKLIDILSINRPEEALKIIQTFIDDKNNKAYLGTAYYQQAQIYYLKALYPDALNSLIKTREYQLNQNMMEKTQFLFGDIYYMLDRYDDAKTFLLEYITFYPDGIFLSEVYFKLGMCSFAQRNWNDAINWFDKVKQKFSGSQKELASIYYIGEVNFLRGKYRDAIDSFEEAITRNFEKDNAAERIAHAYYFNGQYDKAMKAVERIPEKEPYLFDKYMLQGNIEFNRNNNQFALIYYQIARKYAQTGKEIELVLSQTAWTYYKMERYDEAKEAFLSIADDSKSNAPEKYLMLAANAAFNYEDYKQAISLYGQVVKDYKKSGSISEARLGIANAYYNLGDYKSSIKEFSELLSEKPKKKTILVILDGIYWNMLRDKENDYRDEVYKAANSTKDDEIRNKLYSIVLKWETQTEKWSDAVKTGEKIIDEFSYNGEDNENLLLYAEALKQVKNYDKAENIFKKSLKKSGNARIQQQLAELYLTKGDTLQALANLREILTNQPEYSAAVKLLYVSRINDNKNFPDDYANVLASGLTSDFAEAKLEYIEWAIDHKKGKEISKELDNLLKHEKKEIRAQSQYLIGKKLFREKNYSEAIPELLRVKYIYPDFKEIVLNSDYLTCLCYIKSNNKEEAKKIFAVIKDELPELQKANLNRMLK
ncbi:MAG: tetratricopeptide repeat protein, partial [Candidatus Cloacimonetes bacterium]|nr:tetratricopeptide repeat protein [Candidatus Cloacimonadota bacterium]